MALPHPPDPSPLTAPDSRPERRRRAPEPACTGDVRCHVWCREFLGLDLLDDNLHHDSSVVPLPHADADQVLALADAQLAEQFFLRELVSLDLWVPKTCATWVDALRDVVAAVTRTVAGWAGPVQPACDDSRLVGSKLIFLVVTRAVTVLGLSRREAWWKDAEILMLRHQLAVALREQPRAHSRLTWPDRAWLALLAGTLPAGRLAGLRLIVTPATIVRWHRDIVRRRWARLSRRGRLLTLT